MATKPCPNCNHHISTKALVCPKCGHPLSEKLWQESAERERATKRGCLTALTIIVGIFGALVIGGLLLPKSSTPSLMHVVGDSRFGCVSEETLDKLTEYASAGDRAAFVRLLTLAYDTGTCVQFKAGEPLHLVEGQFLDNQKVRRPGDTQEYWTAMETAD